METFMDTDHDDASTGESTGVDLQMLKAMTVTLSKAIEVLERTEPSTLSAEVNFYEEVERFEISLIQRALRETGGNQARAARLLGLNQTTLHGKIKHYGIYPNVLVYNTSPQQSGQNNQELGQMGQHQAG